MNIYEQLQSMRSELAERDAKLKTLQVMDKMLARAASQRESGLSVSRLQVLRHVMSMPEVLNDEDVRLDMLGLEGDLEDAATRRAEDQSRPAYEDEAKRPKLKKYYKKK